MRCGVRAVLRILFCALGFWCCVGKCFVFWIVFGIAAWDLFRCFGFWIVLWIIVLVLVCCFVSGLLYWLLGGALCFGVLGG